MRKIFVVEVQGGKMLPGEKYPGRSSTVPHYIDGTTLGDAYYNWEMLKVPGFPKSLRYASPAEEKMIRAIHAGRVYVSMSRD